MNFKPEHFTLDFVGHRRTFFIIPAAIIIIGMLAMAVFGLNLGVDFKSGTQLQLYYEEHDIAPGVEMEGELDSFITGLGYSSPGEIRFAGEDGQIVYVLFTDILSQDDVEHIHAELEAEYGTIDRSETTVSPEYAQELVQKAIITVLIASAAVIVYVTIRFEYRFAVAAIIALFTDALFIVAIFALFRMEVDLTFLAAVLTIIGYSINDTIVIFDRIRENLKFAKLKTTNDLADLVNQSIRQNLPRAINTSITVVFVAFMLFLFGGEGIRNFSFALLIGLVAGTYSSIFIASQVWYAWKKKEVENREFQAEREAQ